MHEFVIQRVLSFDLFNFIHKYTIEHKRREIQQQRTRYRASNVVKGRRLVIRYKTQKMKKQPEDREQSEHDSLEDDARRSRVDDDVGIGML